MIKYTNMRLDGRELSIEPGWDCVGGFQQNEVSRYPGGFHTMRFLECEGVW
jgi:hypothetical protein